MRLSQKIKSLFVRQDDRKVYTAQQWIDMLASGSCSVTPDAAMGNTAVYACVTLLASTVATLPLHLFKRTAAGHVVDDKHPINMLIAEPHPLMTFANYSECTTTDLGLWGNCYSEIVRDGAGRIRALYPLPAGQTKPIRDGAGIRYETTVDDRTMTLPQERVFHVMANSRNGLKGRSPIEDCNEAVALGIALQALAYVLAKKGPNVQGFFKHPSKLPKEHFESLKKQLSGQFNGIQNAGQLPVLEGGLDFSAIPMNMQQSQFMELRRFQAEEIARIYHVPPHKIGDLERATFSNIEQQSIEWLQDCLRPWLVRIEQAMNRQLLNEADRQQYFFRFSVDGLLRGDTAQRYQSYSTAINTGFMSVNEVRLLEERPAVPGGDTMLSPLNMVPIASRDEYPKIEKRAKATEAVYSSRARITKGFTPQLQESTLQVVHRFASDLEKLMDKGLDAERMTEAVQKITDETITWAQGKFGPSAEALITAIGEAAAAEVGGGTFDLEATFKTATEKMAQKSVLGLRGEYAHVNATGGDATAMLQSWRETAWKNMGQDHAVKASNYAARDTWQQLGVHKAKWVRQTSEPCPICDHVKGRIVTLSSDDGFAAAGESVGGITHDKPVHAPPIHIGCECILEAIQ